MGTAGQSITLANSIIGVGILAMPFCFQQCGIVLATLILLFMGLVSRLCCYFLLKSAILTRRRTYELLAFHVFGPSGKLAVEIGIIGFLMGTCIAYFVVVGDLGPQIIAKLLNINQSDILRTSIMVIVSLVCVLPLGLLRNVDSLSNVSAATIGFYVCLVVKVLSEASSRMFTSDVPLNVNLWRPSGVLQCVPIFSMALFCQTQLFEIFESLPTLSLERMTRVTKNAINICTGVYLTLGIFGYIAFSSQTITGNILMSLGPTMANDVIRLGFVMSLAFSFPLIIFPCRASLYSFLFKKAHSSHHDHIINHSIPERTFRCLTVAIIAASLAISLLLPDISLVLGLVGATIGVLVCVALPAATALALHHGGSTERALAKITLVLGLSIMVLGTYANLEAAENKLDRFDDKIITQEKIDKLVEDFFDKMEKVDDLSLKDTKDGKNLIDMNFKKAVDDSVIQPPNPVPPESQSNEVKSHPDEKFVEKSGKKKESDNLPIEEADKASETHPKNLKTKLKDGISNIIEEKVKIDNKIFKNNKIEVKVEKPNIKEEKKEDKPKEATPQDKTQENIDIIKQKQLIETIKQHGEEQKELIKEQKEILQELQKTKDELKQNKKEVDSSEAKKIAVESIQQIANVAIKSLSSVTDKPIANEDSNIVAKPLEKIANEAVQQIAKKAVETIEAIKEIEEKPKEVKSVKVKKLNDNPVKSEAQMKNGETKKLQQNVNAVPPAQNVPAPQNVNLNQPAQIPSKQNVMQGNGFAQPIVTKLAELNNKQAINNIVPDNRQVKTNSDTKDEVANNIISEVKPVANNDNVNQKLKELEKAHSHAANEPESYKQGETNKQIKPIVNNDIVNKVPIPIAVNNNVVKEVKAEVPKLEDSVVNNIQNNINEAKPNLDKNVPNINSQVRQKREVVDCTNKQVLRPEDKEICEALVDKPELKNDQNEILKNVDLNDNLQRRIPMDNVIHGRSLKMVNEARKR